MSIVSAFIPVRRETGCRVVVFAVFVIYIHTHVSSAVTWGGHVDGRWLLIEGLSLYAFADLWLRGFVSSPTYLADRQPCRFPQSGFMLSGRPCCWGVGCPGFTYPYFILYLNFACPHDCVVLLWVALNPQPFTRNVIIYAPVSRQDFIKEFCVLSNSPPSLKMGDNGVEFPVMPYMGYYFTTLF